MVRSLDLIRLSFSISPLNVGQIETFTFTVQVDTDAISGTIVSNTAQLMSDQTPLGSNQYCYPRCQYIYLIVNRYKSSDTSER